MATRLHMIEQFAPSSIFHDDGQTVGKSDDTYQLDDIGMIQLLPRIQYKPA